MLFKLPYLRSYSNICYQMTEMMDSTTEHYRKFHDVLGKEHVKYEIDSPFDFIQIASEGVGAGAIGNFIVYFSLSRELAASLLNISSSTLYRWSKSNRILERNYSIQLFEITDLFLYGLEVFGNNENFFKWLNLPNTALGGMEPIELVELPGGVAKVRDVIGRIEHGVYS